MPNYLGDVRYWVNSGKHVLSLSFSGFDPFETSGVINVRGRREPKPKRSHAASSITCFVVLSITMGVSKYWNSGWHP